MLSIAESHLNEMEECDEPYADGRKRMRRKYPDARMDVMELIAEYLDGQMSPAEVIEEIRSPA